MKTLYYPYENKSNKYTSMIIKAISQNEIEVNALNKKIYSKLNIKWLILIGLKM